MGRLRFPQFAQLPTDIQLVILDFVCERHVNRYPKGNHTQTEWPAFIRRLQLRLVCRQWCRWFGLDGIREFACSSDKLARNLLLERMTNLGSLEISWPHVELQSDEWERLAKMLPRSLRHLDTCSEKLLEVLPLEMYNSLQTITLTCDTRDLDLAQSVKSLFAKFEGRIKHLWLVYGNFGNEVSAETISDWRYAINDLPLEELSISTWKRLTAASLPLLPPSLKRINLLCDYHEIQFEWLYPTSNSLEQICAPRTRLILTADTPQFPLLRKVKVGDLRADFTQFQKPLGYIFPSLHEFEGCNCTAEVAWQLCSRLPEMSTLRSINLTDSTGGFNLSFLPPLLEEFQCRIRTGKVEGQPPLMKNLRKFHVWTDMYNLPKGVFENMPALQNLKLLKSNEYMPRELVSIELRELLPLRGTLIELDANVLYNTSAEEDVLSNLTKLKVLDLYVSQANTLALNRWASQANTLNLYASQGDTLNLCKLPQSIEHLKLGGAIIINETEELLNLKNLDLFFDESAFKLFKTTKIVLQNTPNLSKLRLCLYSEENIVKLLEECKELNCMSVRELTLFDIIPVPLDSVITLELEFLKLFPRVRVLKIEKECVDSKHLIAFLRRLLSLIKDNQAGDQLETVIFKRPPELNELSHLAEEVEAAVEELRTNYGIHLNLTR